MYEPFWSVVISSSVVPVVIISACGLLCLAFYNRLAAIMTRLRTLQHERFHEYKELFQNEEKSRLTKHETKLYLHFLEVQTAEVLKKATAIRFCIICLLAAIASLILCSLAIGFNVILGFFEWPILFFFVLGLVFILCGLFYAFAEVRIALKPLQMESAFLEKLIKSREFNGPLE